MGLDMYAYRVKPNPKNTAFTIAGEKEDLAYWRKFNALHGWMEERYYEAGGTQVFNCTPLLLNKDLVDELEQNIDNLQPTPGFFFGPQEYTEDDKDEIRKFVAQCREVQAAGDLVYYDSWW